MVCSVKGLSMGGVALAIVDLVFGFYILGYYSKVQHDHFHCPWAQGIRRCDYYVYETNHKTRTIVGLGEGIVSIIFSVVLLVSFLQKLPYLAWSWLLKALIVICINAYFVADWLIKRGRHYHSFYNPDEYGTMTNFMIQGGLEIAIQLILAFIFCCLTASFTYKVRRRQTAEKAAETPI